eukprot:scaffold24725_cov89-Skeletonema_dohrnii-CCMP3373.AAC.1
MYTFMLYYETLYKGIIISGFGPITTLATAIPTLNAATANNTYATVNAPRSNVCRPREEVGFPSSPIVIKPPSSSPTSSKGEGITTESDPVPNDAPTAILLQNSMVAHINGMMPMMNTIRVVVGLSCSMTIGASSSCGGWGIMVVVVESSPCVAAMSEDVEKSMNVVIDKDVVVGSIDVRCKSKLLARRCIDAVVAADSGDDGMINAAALFLLRLEAAAAAWHCFSSATMDTRNASTRCVRLLPM